MRIGLAGIVASAACAAPPANREAGAKERVSGALTTRYRGRFGAGSSDHDLYQVLALDAGDPARDALSIHLLAQAAADLDGSDAGDRFVFYSLDDTHSSRVTARLDHAYVFAGSALGNPATELLVRSVDGPLATPTSGASNRRGPDR